MSLVPVEGKPEFFRDTDTGHVINIRDFRTFDCTFPFEGRRLRDRFLRPTAGEHWMLKSWSIFIHPWPEIIPVSLTAELSINDVIVTEAPLFVIAEPLARPEDKELHERLDVIEKRLDDIENKPDISKLGILRRLVTQYYEVSVKIKGPDEAFVPLRKKATVFEFRLCGLKRLPVKT